MDWYGHSGASPTASRAGNLRQRDRQRVSLEDYLARYAEHHCEWIEGVVIQMTQALKHNQLLYYLYALLHMYFTLKPIGQVIRQPFVLRREFPNRRREPDLIVILNANPNELKNTYVDGARTSA
ncbi:MAG: Uma2 family endonuclease [Anaerolineae bacterium]